MELNIHNNHLKLLTPHFMHIQPAKQGQFMVKGKYNCVSDKYGTLGQVECVGMFTQPFLQLTDNALLLSAGNANYKNTLENQGINPPDIIQVCRFHFIKRNNDAFVKMLYTELPKVHIDIATQLTLL